MHQVNDAIVKGGKLTISHLPFAEGQRVKVVITEENGTAPMQRRPIAEVRQMLKGGVERFDDPCEPMIPTETWEMLK
jgi:hypothetical protein